MPQAVALELTPPLFARALREKIRNRVTLRPRRLCRMDEHDPAMEDAMLNIRIITAGAMVVMMAGAAAAQTDGNATPGKPVSLLQVLLKPAKEKPKAHTRLAHRHTAKSTRRFASRKSHLAAVSDDPAPAAATSPVAAQPAAAPEAAPTALSTPANVWPADTATSLPAAAAAADAAPGGQPVPAQSSSSAPAADGSAVQISSPDEVNAIDLAADAPAEAAPKPNAQIDEQMAAPAVVALAQQDDGKSSRDIWYEELLATLGGAFAAASVAWLLIGFAPPRRDGRDRMLIYETERMTR